MTDLSKEYVIQQVMNHKDRIRDATDRLSDIIHQGRKNVGKYRNIPEQDSLTVRKIVHEIVSELSLIGGYCDGWSKQYIHKTAAAVAGMTSTASINDLDAIMLEYWAVRVNSIIIDFNKTPFKLSDLKPIFSVLEKALGNRSSR